MSLVKTTLIQGAPHLNINLTSAMLDQLTWYADFLRQQNKNINLTAITDPVDVAEKHFLDALTVAEDIKDKTGCKMIDIGSGAGIPGLPIKIYRPDIDLVLLESVHKKVAFIDQVVQHLKLTDTRAVWDRAESYAKNHRECFDVAISRAVADMTVLVEYALPLVRVGGVFIAYKSVNYAQELTRAAYALKILGGRVADIKTLQLPISGETRVLIKVNKIAPTPSRYPRRVGLASKKPLIK